MTKIREQNDERRLTRMRENAAQRKNAARKTKMRAEQQDIQNMRYISIKTMPIQAKANGLELDSIPAELSDVNALQL